MTDEQARIDTIYDEVDHYFRMGRFEFVDERLKGIDLNGTPFAVLIGWLTATLPAKSKLSYRPEFLQKIKDKYPDPDEFTMGLYNGLE